MYLLFQCIYYLRRVKDENFIYNIWLYQHVLVSFKTDVAYKIIIGSKFNSDLSQIQ
jgi:hypothetical protein